MIDDAETSAQRRGNKSGSRRRADQSKFRQINFDRTRRRALSDHQIELKIFHRRIQNFFDCRTQAVNLVNK